MADAERDLIIAVTTYRRTDALAVLLPAIDRQAQEFTDRDVRRIVVDNDPDQSAADVAAHAGWEYAAEERAGIGAARHRALAAGAGRDLVVMLDDDLTPEEGWLRALVSTWSALRPTAVMGLVRYHWPEGTDPWLSEGGFFRRQEHPTGTRLPSLATGNVLIDAADAARRGVQFDADRGLAGGEDTQFGAALVAAGGTIVACAESVAHEEIPAHRATRDFVRRRAISHGESRSRMRLEPLQGARLAVTRAVLLAGGALRWAAFSAANALAHLRRDVPSQARFRRRAWFALGRIRGATGRFGAEYARTS